MAASIKRSLIKICFIAAIAFSVSLVAGTAFALVDINNASVKDLESLPGVGPVIAKKIVANRPYSNVDELTKAGLSKKAIEKIKPLVTTGSATASDAVKTKTAGATDAAKAKTSAATDAAKAKTSAAASKLAPGQKVNINAATKDQLVALPGIGPAKAQAIIDGRPYKTTEDIMKVKGIKQGVYNKIKDYITVQ